MFQRRASRTTIRLALPLAAVVAAAACGGGGGGSSAKGEVFTIVLSSPPASMDPFKANVGTDNWPVNLAYASLIHWDENGKLVPDLATSWGYVGEGNKVFELNLRQGVKFSDGTPLDAQAVVASLDYARTKGLNVGWVSAIDKVEAVGAAKVRITCRTPHPALPRVLSQIQLIGSVASPKGVADPARMGTQTFGAGPYMLDPKQTATGSRYTFVPNPHYWDKTRVFWKKVVVRVIANPNSALQSLKAGQADLASIDANLVSSAKSAGLAVKNTPLAFLGVNLVDREGEVAKPLKDVRVRRALNLAVDRPAITKALFQEYGQPTNQITLPGLDGYVPEYDNRYPYDLDKAKRLLREAGYGGGFKLKLETQTFLPTIGQVTQAVLEQWKKLGVEAEVTTDSTVGQWLQNATSGKYPALGFAYGGLPTYLMSLDWMTSAKTHFNPFSSQDPRLTRMLGDAAAAPPEKQPALYQDVMRHVVDQAWFVSVLRFDVIYTYNSKRVQGMEVSAQSGLPDVVWSVRPA